MSEDKEKRTKNAIKKVVQWGIETGASDEEIVERFGYKNLDSWRAVKHYIKRKEPELIEQLKSAQRLNRMTGFFRKQREYQEIIKNLGEENIRLKARIVVLEQELEKYKQGINATREAIPEQGMAPKQKENQTQNESKLDRLLRIFDTGKISEEDEAVLKDYQKQLEFKRIQQEMVHRAGNSLIYSNMISTIRKMLSTRQENYQTKIVPELKKFISPQDYGPLYDLPNNATMGELIKRMNMVVEQKVSGVEVAMLINQLQAEGQADQISDKLNLEAISNMRSRIEDWYEKIKQEFLPQEKERDD